MVVKQQRMEEQRTPIEINTPEILGELTGEELDASSTIKPWYQELEKYTSWLCDIIVDPDVRGNNTKSELLTQKFEEMLGGWLR